VTWVISENMDPQDGIEWEYYQVVWISDAQVSFQ